MSNFWKELEKPIVGLSPMDGVTDAAFRFMVAKYGNPSVMYTEFVSVDALRHVKAKGTERVMSPFIYDSIERPIVAQVFGKEPKLFYDAAVVAAELGFDGLDINMGCPAKKVAQNGSGAGLIRTPKLAQEIVLKAKRGLKDWYNGSITLEETEVSEQVKKWVGKRKQQREKKLLPVSVKTRIGVDSDVVGEWMRVLVETKPMAIAVHGRTLIQMYQGKADWEALGRASKIVRSAGIVFLGNGDVDDLEGVEKRIKEYQVDGALIGRGSFGNPGVFAGLVPDEGQKKAWMLEHARKYEEIFGNDPKVFFPMRKHLAWYSRGFPGASEMRGRLMKCESVEDVKRILASV